MNALLIVAHGSRSPEANEEVLRLARSITKHHPLTAAAFLEIAAPAMDDTVAMLIRRGATQITVLPYFLTKGRHVTHDIPHQVRKAKEKYPQLHFKILSHLGAFPGIDHLVLEMLKTP